MLGTAGELWVHMQPWWGPLAFEPPYSPARDALASAVLEKLLP